MKKISFITLPEDMQNIIFDYTICCKKNEVFCINKELYKMLNNKFGKCNLMMYIGNHVCTQCDDLSLLFKDILSNNIF